MSACAPAGTLLGQTTEYVDTYRPDLLTPIPRSLGRDAIGVHDFRGTDVWRLYEITWINERGLPVAAAGEIRVPATSPCIVESKSLKLYIGSLTQTKIASVEEAARLIGFGTFGTSERAARVGRNPHTGQEIQIPAGRVVRFSASANFKEAVK